MTEKQVIFIGGTSYSGSTMLDMMLANGDGGFSCGELVAAFQPYRQHHLTPDDESAGGSSFPWRSVIDAGPDRVHEAIFAADESIDRIIDSSKDPFWISARASALAKRGIRTRNLLIWKTPSEFHQSRSKRGRERGWRRAWVNYHTVYFRLIREWAAVAYRPLVTDSQTLEKTCEFLEIDYFPGKEKFWDGTYDTLFGNSRAKIHLFDENSQRFESFDREISALKDEPGRGTDAEAYRSIYYEAPEQGSAKDAGNHRMAEIVTMLERHGVDRISSENSTSLSVPRSLQASLFAVHARRLKRQIYSDMFRLLRG